MQELVCRVQAALPEPWQKKTGRRRACGLYRAVELSCMALRQNDPQEFLGDLREVSQSTVSRIKTALVPIIREVLAEFVPSAQDAIEVVEGRVCLVDGTIMPCWSYADRGDLWSRKRGVTGFNVQVVTLLDGTPVYLSDPQPGNMHDATAFTETSVATIVANSGGGIADKGYQGTAMITPKKQPKKGELSDGDKASNKEISTLRAPVERVIAHVKSWRMLHSDYRRPHPTYQEAFKATRALFFFSITWGFE